MSESKESKESRVNQDEQSNNRCKARRNRRKTFSRSIRSNQCEVSLMSPFVEGGFIDNKIRLSAIVDVVGYGLRDRDQEIVVECELEVESEADTIESDEFRFDAARNGSLATDTLPQLTQRETVLCLGEDLQVILTFAYK